jgi:hypothetical protein
MVTAPIAVHQRRKLNRLPTLREEQNKMRILVNELTVENNELEALNGKVEIQASRLSTAETELSRMAEEQGSNVDELQGLIQENGVLIREMRALQECQVMGQMMKAIIDSDRSRDFKIDDAEMHVLVMRLRGIQGLQHVSEDDLRSVFASQSTGSVKGIVDITKELMKKDQLQIVRNAEHESKDAGDAVVPEVV